MQATTCCNELGAHRAPHPQSRPSVPCNKLGTLRIGRARQGVAWHSFWSDERGGLDLALPGGRSTVVVPGVRRTARAARSDSAQRRRSRTPRFLRSSLRRVQTQLRRWHSLSDAAVSRFLSMFGPRREAARAEVTLYKVKVVGRAEIYRLLRTIIGRPGHRPAVQTQRWGCLWALV